MYDILINGTLHIKIYLIPQFHCFTVSLFQHKKKSRERKNTAYQEYLEPLKISRAWKKTLKVICGVASPVRTAAKNGSKNRVKKYDLPEAAK